MHSPEWTIQSDFITTYSLKARDQIILVYSHVLDDSSYIQCWSRDITEKDVKTLEQIELDICRTFPDNRFFREDSNQDKKKLYNILVAYSQFNKEIGYCQVHNQV